MPTDETTIFVYDAGGILIGEDSTIVAAAEDAKVAYLTTDHLGSPRINTDRDGKITSRHDYHEPSSFALTTTPSLVTRYCDSCAGFPYRLLDREE